MSDWREKIDNYYDEQKRRNELAEQNRLTKEQQDSLQRQKDKEKREQDEYNRNIIRLGKRFKCHVCGIASALPGRQISTSREFISQGETGQYVNIKHDYGPDWHIPGDMAHCSMCNKWTCREHIFKGMCLKCAEKL